MSSSMLEQAIIDAKELKESAQRNAEEAIVEKYQFEIKEAVEKILEQDDLGLGGADMGGGLGAAAAGKPESAKQPEAGKDQVDMVLEQLPFLQTTDDNEVIELDLAKLEESLNIVSEVDETAFEERFEDDKDEFKVDAKDLGLDEELELEEDMLEEDDLDEEVTVNLSKEQAEELIQRGLGKPEGGGASPIAEDLSLEEMIAEALEEMLGEEDVLEEDEDLFEIEDLEEEKKPDFPDVDGDGDTKEPISKAQKDKKEKEGGESKKDKDYSNVPPQLRKHMQKESKLLQRKNKTLIKEQTRMSSKVQLLENKLDKYGTVIDQLKQKLDESNLASAKLLYQNRVLDSVSLNERQKDRIVEAIKDAETVEEAKIIFETLQSTVETAGQSSRGKESLDEVVYRGSSAFMPLKEDKQKVSDPFVARMKTLAGLK